MVGMNKKFFLLLKRYVLRHSTVEYWQFDFQSKQSSKQSFYRGI